MTANDENNYLGCLITFVCPYKSCGGGGGGGGGGGDGGGGGGGGGGVYSSRALISARMVRLKYVVLNSLGIS